MPETFRVVRELLNRIDDSATGVMIPELHTEIPAYVRAEAEKLV